MEPVIQKVVEFIDRHSLIKKSDRILMSLSAGKDSMFLLHALCVIGEERGFETGIFHLNHMMRGEESDLDELHVEDRARVHGLEVFIRRHDFAQDAYRGESFEEHARNLRYRMASEIAREHGYNIVATAHTLDDSVETVLMRIFGGTGIHGLQGIPPTRGMIVRPLLSITADEIYTHLQSHAIAWREDLSNEDPAYSRNFIRNRIIPLARDKFPMLQGSVGSLSELARDTINLLDRLLVKNYGNPVRVDGEIVRIDANVIKDDYPAFCHIVSRAIREHFEHPVNRRMIDIIHAKYTLRRANIDIYTDNVIHVVKAYRDGRSLLELTRYAPKEPYEDAEWEYRVDLDDRSEKSVFLKEIGIPVAVKLVDYEYFLKFVKNSVYAFIALENSINTIYIRNRRKGDRILTENGTKKIKDLLIEMKLDGASKNRVPILVAGESIAACMPGLILNLPNRVSPDFLVDKKSKKVLAVFKKSD
ncbi:MAG: tRNA lysidine(34) synthetase TilS [Spirochaetes bacterium]|nr:tRNA lysidine(34) synthetase TilS [Spirochaetota bacterium]